jgi:hypothetical protein
MPGARHTVATTAAQRRSLTVDKAMIEQANEKAYRALPVPIDIQSSVCGGGSA